MDEIDQDDSGWILLDDQVTDSDSSDEEEESSVPAAGQQNANSTKKEETPGGKSGSAAASLSPKKGSEMSSQHRQSWIEAYESQKRKALEMMESKKTVSVCGVSAYAGNVKADDSKLVRSTEVTKILNRLKTEPEKKKKPKNTPQSATANALKLGTASMTAKKPKGPLLPLPTGKPMFPTPPILSNMSVPAGRGILPTPVTSAGKGILPTPGIPVGNAILPTPVIPAGKTNVFAHADPINNPAKSSGIEQKSDELEQSIKSATATPAGQGMSDNTGQNTNSNMTLKTTKPTKDAQQTGVSTTKPQAVVKEQRQNWFETYEAQKKKALEGMQSKQDVSVTGASSFAGRMRTDDSEFVRTTEVTKVLKQLQSGAGGKKNAQGSKLSNTSVANPEAQSHGKDAKTQKVAPTSVAHQQNVRNGSPSNNSKLAGQQGLPFQNQPSGRQALEEKKASNMPGSSSMGRNPVGGKLPSLMNLTVPHFLNQGQQNCTLSAPAALGLLLSLQQRSLQASALLSRPPLFASHQKNFQVNNPSPRPVLLSPQQNRFQPGPSPSRPFLLQSSSHQSPCPPAPHRLLKNNTGMESRSQPTGGASASGLQRDFTRKKPMSTTNWQEDYEAKRQKVMDDLVSGKKGMSVGGLSSYSASPNKPFPGRGFPK